jgi:protein phosphatase PTC1
VDEKLSILAEEQGSSSGCTAVTVFLRLEDEEGNPVAHAKTGGIDKNSRSIVKAGGAAATSGTSEEESARADTSEGASEKSHSGGGLLSSIARKMRHSGEGDKEDSSKADVGEDGLVQVQGKEVKRVLYTANVGDARAVLW